MPEEKKPIIEVPGMQPIYLHDAGYRVLAGLRAQAEALGVSRQSVNELLRTRRALSPEMALRLARLFGNSAEFWLNAQRAVDLWEAAQAIAERTVRPGREPGAVPAPQLPAAEPATWDAVARRTWREAFCLARQERARRQLDLLDAPLLFVKQHPYFAGHIYDDFYPWHPGGGIYVLEDPTDPRPDRTVRPVIDPATNETLGEGVYRDPDLFWDASKLVFAHKGEPNGVTSLYEIGTNGRGLKRITASDTFSDYQPAYLPDGRIVSPALEDMFPFLSREELESNRPAANDKAPIPDQVSMPDEPESGRAKPGPGPGSNVTKKEST